MVFFIASIFIFLKSVLFFLLNNIERLIFAYLANDFSKDK